MAVRAIAQVRLSRDNALPEDDVVNVMHFEGDNDDGLAMTDRDRWDDLAPGLADRLVTLYQALGSRLGSILSGAGMVKLYDFEDPKPRVPRLERAFTLTPSTSTLPAEVALCVSMEAARVAGQPQARRRGRIFLGPVSSGIGGPDESDFRPSMAQAPAILTEFQTMATGSAGSFRLAVYSPTVGAISGRMDEAWNDVTTLYIDNAFDTQRRRGSRPTARSTLAL